MAAPNTARAATSPPMTPRPAIRRGAGSPCPAIRQSRSRMNRWQRAAKTWDPAGKYWINGGGGTAWDTMAFDPELNLVYIGTGNGSPWNHNVAQPLRRRQPLSGLDRRAECRHRKICLALPGNARRPLGLYRDPADDPGRHQHRRRAAQGDPARAEERLLLRHRPHQRQVHLGEKLRRRELGDRLRRQRPADRGRSRRATKPPTTAFPARTVRTTGTRCRSIRRPAWCICRRRACRSTSRRKRT